MKISQAVIATILAVAAATTSAEQSDQPRHGRDSVYATAVTPKSTPPVVAQKERANGRDSVYAMGKRVTTHMHSAESSLLKRFGRS